LEGGEAGLWGGRSSKSLARQLTSRCGLSFRGPVGTALSDICR